MKRKTINSIFGLAAFIGVGLLPALHAGTAGDPVAAADKAFVKAYEKGDMPAVKKYLDADFTWIDTDGVYYSKDDALALGLKPLVPSGDDIKIVEHKYGKVVWIQENQGNKYAAHFWVERPNGWKLLHNSEIATRPASENPDGRSPYAIPCVNPCQVMPYVPVTANEKAAIKGWMEQEDGTPEHWRMHVGDDQVVIGSYGVSTKMDRWNMNRQTKSQRAQSRSGAGFIRAHVGPGHRGGRRHVPTHLRRQGVLVQPRLCTQ